MSEGRPDYGVDAPVIVRRFAILGVTAVLVAALLCATSFRMTSLAVGAVGAWSIACAVVMVAGSKIGKFRLRDALLSRIPWRGDERVADRVEVRDGDARKLDFEMPGRSHLVRIEP